MKTFVKKNLIWVFALVVGIGTMSFKVIQKQNVSEYWFKVENDIVLDDPAPANCEDDEGTVCAVAFSQNITPYEGMTIGEARDHDYYANEAKRE